jgi:hypothetical protein
VKLPVATTSTEYASADTMILDEAGIELLIDGEMELGASFENLDSFQLAYAVLPEDFDSSGLEQHMAYENAVAQTAYTEEELEASIWVFSQELAKRRGYLRK